MVGHPGVSVTPTANSHVGVGHSSEQQAVGGKLGKSDGSVFRSCFGLGHGRGRPALKSSQLPWFNLKMMDFQPSFTTALEDGEVRVVENMSNRLEQSHILSLTASTNSPITLPILLLHLSLNEHIGLLVTMLVKRGKVSEGVGIRLGLSDGTEESLEEVSPELLERRKRDFGFNLDEEAVLDDEDWVEVAFEAGPSKARVVEKLGVHLPGDLPDLPGASQLAQVPLPGVDRHNQVEIASINISTALF